MKKLLIATVIAVATSTTAYAAPVNMTYDVDVVGITYFGRSGGDVSGVGTAIITLDIDDLSQNGLFSMTTVNTISTLPIESSSIVTHETTGVFDAMEFWGGTGEMNFVGGSAQTVSVACPGLGFPIICNHTETSFIIESRSMVVTGPGDIVEFRENLVIPDQPLAGDVITISNFTLTLVSTEPVNPVPVPAAAWLFGSALVGLAGIGRKRKAA